MGDLERVGRSFSLLVWILVLAALGILFGSCTSSYSPSTLYFFKVHLQPSNPNDSLQHEESYANLPTFYAVGLLGFCQGQKDITRFSNCSNPSLLFSFDPLETLRSMSNQTQSIQEPGAVELYLDQHRFARYSIWAYLIGLVATFFAATFGLFRPRLSRTKLFHIISAILSPLSIIAASVNLSLIYSLMDHNVQTNLRPVMANASFGSLFIAAWSASGLSLAALVVWCICASCCCI